MGISLESGIGRSICSVWCILESRGLCIVPAIYGCGEL